MGNEQVLIAIDSSIERIISKRLFYFSSNSFVLICIHFYVMSIHIDYSLPSRVSHISIHLENETCIRIGFALL